MRRREVEAADAAELAALDRILAEEPVAASDLELAALVASVRAEAPRLDDDIAARLDDRLSAAASPDAPWRRRRRDRVAAPATPTPYRRRRIAAASAVAFAAVAAVVVVSINAATQSGTVTQESLSARGVGIAPAVAPAVPPSAATASPEVNAPAAGPAGSARLQQRAATLTLATGVPSFAQVANEIVAGTEQLGGVVQTSNVSEAGSASLATFSLTVPSGSLSQLIATLSRLARVQSLNQSTQDITDAYHQATSRLQASRGERDALFVALGRATTPNETASLHDRIDALNGLIAAELRAVDALSSQARTATLAVTLQPAPTPSARADGTLRTSLHDALDVLQVSLAVAIVALAVLAPLVVLGLLGWWMSRTLRQRARERALQSG